MSDLPITGVLRKVVPDQRLGRDNRVIATGAVRGWNYLPRWRWPVSRSSFLKRALSGWRDASDLGGGGPAGASVGDHRTDVTDSTSEDHPVAGSLTATASATDPEQLDGTFEIISAADPIRAYGNSRDSNKHLVRK
jgi:hypothetical protein